MTAALLWKEYRQQRTVWLAIAFLAILLVICLAETLGHGSNWQVFRDERLRDSLNLVVSSLIVSYGVVCGALLLAGESDDGTLAFLDTLTGWRSLLWTRKCLAGVLLTLSLSVALIGLALGLGFGSWKTVISLPLLGLDALAWGLLGGALCRKVLTAVLTGIGFMALIWFLFAPWDDAPLLFIGKPTTHVTADQSDAFPYVALLLFLGKAVTVGIAGYVSWWSFCRNDRLRRYPPLRTERGQVVPLIGPTRVLLWLMLRQGRWVLAAGIAGAVVLGLILYKSPLILWPLGALLLGLLCGLAVFASDQNDGVRFLGAQRLPPGRIWTTKILFWAAVLLGLLVLAVGVDAVGKDKLHHLLLRTAGWEGSEGQTELGQRAEFISPVVFLLLWPLYGFCFGQFFGQLMRRPVLAVSLACFIAPAALAVWLPAMLFGGLPAWQPFLIPVVLLLLTRWTQWPWMCERLLSVRPLLAIAEGQVVMVLIVAGCLWYRVASVPEVGEPFDVKAFKQELSELDKSEAGSLLRHAGADLITQQQKVEEQLRPPPQPAPAPAPPPGPGGPAPAPRPAAPGAPPMVAAPPMAAGGFGGPGAAGPASAPLSEWDMFFIEGRPHWGPLLDYLLCNGWPKQDKELNRWLDRLFEGEWVQETEKAVRLPLGMLQSPYQPAGRAYGDCGAMATLFIVRALQRQAHGDSRGALHDLETVLALSRQVRNFASAAILENCVVTIEASTLSGFRAWLQNAGPDKELLRDALALLQRHEAELPDPTNTVKVQYLIYRDDMVNNGSEGFHKGTSSPLVKDLLTAAFQFPGEKERQIRIANAIVAGELREIHQPLWQSSGRNKTEDKKNADPSAVPAAVLGLPPPSGPGSDLSVQQWGELVQQFKMNGFVVTQGVQVIAARSQQMLSATQLTFAVSLYQADHGKPPELLDDLVPAYLDSVPVDPFTGQPFAYRISSGEKVRIYGQLYSGVSCEPVTLAPGQAVVGSENSFYIPVPLWKSKELK